MKIWSNCSKDKTSENKEEEMFELQAESNALQIKKSNFS